MLTFLISIWANDTISSVFLKKGMSLLFGPQLKSQLWAFC